MYEQALSELSQEMQLIVYSCQSRIDAGRIRQIVAHFQADDYQRTFALAQRHGLFPLLYQTLASMPEILLPSKTLTIFKRSFMDTLQRNMMMSAELTELMRLFVANNIGAIAFKGPALAAAAYGNISLRQYGDLDILIRKEELHKTLSLLQERGYIPEIELQEEALETFYRCVNVIGLQRGAVRVEIHWELLSRNYAINFDSEKLWTDLVQVKIDRRPVPMLSFENHLLYLCAHGSKHLFERLEWICDIDRLLRSRAEIDWQRLSAEANTLGIERMLLLGLNLARLFFNLSLPRDVSEKIEADTAVERLTCRMIALHYSPEELPLRSSGSFWLLWRMREKAGDRLRFAWRALFAPKFDDFRFVKLPRQLLFLYPFVRPVRLILKSLPHRSHNNCPCRIKRQAKAVEDNVSP